MSESIDIKIQAKRETGNFWGKDGAIADTRKLAIQALNQPGSSLIDGLSLMINIHTQASKHALTDAPHYRHSLKLYRKSQRALRFYNTIWGICSFFSYV